MVVCQDFKGCYVCPLRTNRKLQVKNLKLTVLVSEQAVSRRLGSHCVQISNQMYM